MGRLLHLVNQLLDYRKAELGVFGLKVKPSQVHRIIEKMCIRDRYVQPP